MRSVRARLRFPAALVGLAVCACAARAPVEPRAPGAPRAISFAWSGEADAVWLVGSMTGWGRVPLAREGGGRFSTSLAVPDGRHEYHLEVEVDGVTRLIIPDGVERVDDGYGGENALLRVGGL